MIKGIKAIKLPKVFLDTNVLYPAILYSGSVCSRALNRVFALSVLPITSDYVLGELRRIFKEKCPGDIWRLDLFLGITKHKLLVVETPEDTVPEENMVRDENDRPIARVAFTEDVDVILSFDKDLKEAGFVHPLVLDALEFMEWNPKS